MNTPAPEDFPFLSPEDYLESVEKGNEPARQEEDMDSFFSSSEALNDVFNNIASNPSKQPKSPFAPQTAEEMQLAAKIESMKHRFYTFENALLGNLQADDKRYASLKEPFDIMRNNESNECPNSAVINRVAAQRGVPVPLIALGELKDVQHFSYGQMPANTAQGHMLYAGFAPSHQMIAFQELENMNDLDNIVLHHELRHIRHYANRRKELGDEKYFQLIFANHQKPHVFIEDELDAYGQEMEALNVLMNGRLATLKSNGYQEMCEVLQVRHNQQTPAQFLALMSDAYFAPKKDGEQYSQEFQSFIINTQLHDGYAVCNMRNGKICVLQQ